MSDWDTRVGGAVEVFFDAEAYDPPPSPDRAKEFYALAEKVRRMATASNSAPSSQLNDAVTIASRHLRETLANVDVILVLDACNLSRVQSPAEGLERMCDRMQLFFPISEPGELSEILVSNEYLAFGMTEYGITMTPQVLTFSNAYLKVRDAFFTEDEKRGLKSNWETRWSSSNGLGTVALQSSSAATRSNSFPPAPFDHHVSATAEYDVGPALTPGTSPRTFTSVDQARHELTCLLTVVDSSRMPLKSSVPTLKRMTPFRRNVCTTFHLDPQTQRSLEHIGYGGAEMKKYDLTELKEHLTDLFLYSGVEV
ncbi:hypothetical protein [Streptomyces sp. NPDC052693]|uniref:hypothetical protein n=1 Tax=Streptomyces sp. NPDC052693 TaxID=3155814 RepID=UPI00341A9F2C